MFFERLPELVTTNRNGDEIRRMRRKSTVVGIWSGFWRAMLTS